MKIQSGGSAAAIAAEAARKAAEAARRAAEAARQAAANRAASQARSSFESAQPAKASATPAAPASSLLTENPQDGSVNCLDVAADWVSKASPALRARSELVFLQDSRTGAEGQSGHVLVRQGERVLDPTTNQSYASLADYQRAHPQYREVGTLPATSAARIFSTPAGSPERAAALAQARVPEGLQRMMVADTQATTAPRTLDPASVAQAEEDFALLQEAHYLSQPHFAAELLQEHADDPDYQAHLIGLMAEGGADSMLNNVVGGIDGLFVQLFDSGTYRTGTDADRQTLVDAMRAAREAGTLTDADLQAMLAAAPAPWNDAVARLGFSPVQRTEGADDAVGALEEATDTYESAQEAAKAKDEELARQLAAFGPALTEQQVADYVAAFRAHPDNAEAYQALEAAAAELAEVVRTQGPALENAAITRPEDAEALAHSLELLAGSSQAQVAVELGARALADPSSPLGQALGAVPDFEQRVMEQGIPNAASQILAEAATPEAAFAELQRLLGPLAPVAGGAVGGRTDIKDALEAIRLASQGDYSRLEQLARNFEQSSPLLRGLSAAGVVFGAVGAVNAGRDGDYLKMLQGLASSGESGLKLVAAATRSLTDAGKLAQFGVDAAETARFASFATKLAPALGLVANATAFAIHLNELQDDPNAGEVVALLGDSLGVLGSAMELFPPTAPVGLLVSGIGAVVTALGEGLSWLLERHEFTAQQREFLAAAGISEALLDTLVNAEEERVHELVTELGMTPAQVQQLATDYPWLLTEGSGNGLNLDSFVRMSQAYGLSGTEVFDMLRGIGEGAEDPAHVLSVVLTNLSREAALAETPADFQRALERIAAGMPEELRMGFDNLLEYLRDASSAPAGGRPAPVI